jgi:two-component system cell cycle response regulator DivK
MALILHIEDNASNRKVVRYLLRAGPHEVIAAVNGQQGLEVAASEVPDLILLDIQLPVLSGYEVAQRLKADDDLKHIPLIAITSYALGGDDNKALAAGCDDYIAKPYKPQHLMDCLARHLDAQAPSTDE